MGEEESGSGSGPGPVSGSVSAASSAGTEVPQFDEPLLQEVLRAFNVGSAAEFAQLARRSRHLCAERLFQAGLTASLSAAGEFCDAAIRAFSPAEQPPVEIFLSTQNLYHLKNDIVGIARILSLESLGLLMRKLNRQKALALRFQKEGSIDAAWSPRRLADDPLCVESLAPWFEEAWDVLLGDGSGRVGVAGAEPTMQPIDSLRQACVEAVKEASAGALQDCVRAPACEQPPQDMVEAVLQHYETRLGDVFEALWRLQDSAIVILNSIDRQTTLQRSEKVFADPIYGSVSLPSWIVQSVVDTRPVQRLKSLAQIGVGWQVYPAATHNRFAHSVGVAHLARQWWDCLVRAAGVQRCRETDIVAEDLMVAGLCHDLGHGPFSHMFELFVNTHCKSRERRWHHEDMSLALVDLIAQERRVGDRLPDDRLRNVKRMMHGADAYERPPSGAIDEVDNLKLAQHQIVANPVTGIDVDRFDYLQRDALITDNLPRFKPQRMMQLSQVVDGVIHFHEKERPFVMNLYSCRRQMFERVYLHRKVVAADYMVCDMLAHRVHFTDLEAQIDDPERFLELDDSVIKFFPTNETDLDADARQHLRMARELNDRYMRRDFYRFCGMFDFRGDMTEERQQRFSKRHLMHFLPPDSPVREKDIIFGWRSVDYGSGSKSPMEAVSFCDASGAPVSAPGYSPFEADWLTTTLRVYCREAKFQNDLLVACEAWRASFAERELAHSLVGSSQAGPRARGSSPLSGSRGAASPLSAPGDAAARGWPQPLWSVPRSGSGDAGVVYVECADSPARPGHGLARRDQARSPGPPEELGTMGRPRRFLASSPRALAAFPQLAAEA